MPKGLFITVEGPDGSGKSTLIAKLASRLRREGFKVRKTREPGGSPLAEKIRAILLSPASRAMSDRAELLLFEAARRQHLDETIEPALAAGRVVLCDRFADSTTAYQGAGRAIRASDVAWLNHFACQGRKPDLTLVLNVDPAAGLRRAGRLKGGRDRMEQAGLGFHKRVRAAFLKLARREPRRVKVIDSGRQGPQEVFETAWRLVQARLKKKKVRRGI